MVPSVVDCPSPPETKELKSAFCHCPMKPLPTPRVTENVVMAALTPGENSVLPLCVRYPTSPLKSRGSKTLIDPFCDVHRIETRCFPRDILSRRMSGAPQLLVTRNENDSQQLPARYRYKCLHARMPLVDRPLVRILHLRE